jgi:hypothetical protein
MRQHVSFKARWGGVTNFMPAQEDVTHSAKFDFSLNFRSYKSTDDANSNASKGRRDLHERVGVESPLYSPLCVSRRLNK